MQQPINLPHLGEAPKQATPGAVAYDLCSAAEYLLQPGQTLLIKTGLTIAIPEGYVGMVCSRSGLALKNQIIALNAPGIIDPDYRGEVGVILSNFGDSPFDITIGTRVAQLVFVPVAYVRWLPSYSLPVTQRGEGGFGSTGLGSVK